MRCVIFDLDGTLADTSGDLIAAANHCFAGMGQAVRLDPVADAGTALQGGRAMLNAGLERAGVWSHELVDTWYPELLSAYNDAIALHTTYYPQALETVETLCSTGHAVGICTNKPYALAEKLLAQLGGRDLFGALIGADSLSTRKPDVAPYWAAVDQAGGTRGQSLLVGDTETDRQTSAAAGVPSILVTYAPHGDSVKALTPEGLIDHLSELPAEVARLLAD